MQLIVGAHSIIEAFQSGTTINHVCIIKNYSYSSDTLVIIDQLKRGKIPIRYITKDEFQRASNVQGGQHILAYVNDFSYLDLPYILKHQEKFPLIVALDHLEDPYNMGAIIRSCAALGVSCVMFPKHRTAKISAGVIKASSGAIYHTKLVRTTNLAQSVEKLKKNGFWIYGSHVTKGVCIHSFKPNFPMVLLVGNENKGLSKRLISLCDVNLHITMKGSLDSLNVSVATGILLHHIGKALKF